MKFEWDEAKNRQNIRKHGFDFVNAPEMFAGVLLVAPDTREDYDEDRWVGVGTTRGRIATIVFAEHDETLRIISLRKASRYERDQYAKAFKNKLETH